MKTTTLTPDKIESLTLARRLADAATGYGPKWALDGRSRSRALADALASARAWDVDLTDVPVAPGRGRDLEERARGLVKAIELALAPSRMSNQFRHRNEAQLRDKIALRIMRRGVTAGRAIEAAERLTNRFDPAADREPGWVLRDWQIEQRRERVRTLLDKRFGCLISWHCDDLGTLQFRADEARKGFGGY
jgi:hypothetical protein